MPYRQNNNGTLVAVRTTNRPQRAMGCGPSGCPQTGMGAAVTRSGKPFSVQPGATVVTQGAYSGPGMSKAAVSALGAGARSGSRAARYAVAVVQARGLGGMGDAVSDAQAAVEVATTADPTDPNYAANVAVANQNLMNAITAQQQASASSSSGGGIFNSVFGTAPIAPTLLTAANQGYQAYNAFGKPVARPVPVAAPMSTGAILAILGVIATLGIGVAVVMSGKKSAPASTTTTTVKANRGRRTPRYFIQHRKAA